MTRHFLTMDSVTAEELAALLDKADAMKAARASSETLAGRSVAMIFEKPSTRTRISFEVAITELGATPVVLNAGDLQLGRGETIEDTARVLSRYCHAVVVRTFEQDRLERLARAGQIPVINALSDLEHPCQALADLQTVREQLGAPAGKTLVYVGDGNNVAHSLLLAGALAGMNVVIASPPGYEPIPQMVKRAESLAESSGGSVAVMTDAAEAVAGADVVYTDVWASMGQEREAEERRLIFAPYQLNATLLEQAAPHAIVMHCLPAHRGEEITDDVFEGEHSVVWDQAENRLHAQKALLEWLVP